MLIQKFQCPTHETLTNPSLKFPVIYYKTKFTKSRLHSDSSASILKITDEADIYGVPCRVSPHTHQKPTPNFLLLEVPLGGITILHRDIRNERNREINLRNDG